MSLDPRMLIKGAGEKEWEHLAEVPLPGGGSKKMLAVVVESMSNQVLGIIVQNVVQNCANILIEPVAQRVIAILEERRIIPAAKK